MYVINNSVPLQGVLEQKFGERSSIFDPVYPRRAILRSMRERIRSRLRVVSGPQYWGEAEALILKQLFGVVASAAQPNSIYGGDVTSKAYQLSAAYSLIANICAVCEERKIAEIISMTGIKSNPLVKQMMDYMTATPTSSATTTTAAQLATNIWKDLETVYKQISIKATTAATAPNPQKPGVVNNPVQVLVDALKMPSDITLEQDAQELFSQFTRYLRQGKGPALSRQDRKRLMGQWAAFLSNLDTLISNYEHGVDIAFTQAYTAMYWTLEYFKIVDDYEAVFPSASMRLMSSLWMKSISTRCVTLSKFFFKIAVCVTAFDLRIAQKCVNETETFFSPLLMKGEHTYTDYAAKWKETQQLIEAATEPFGTEAAEQLYEELKSYIGVQHFLPNYYFANVFSAIKSEFDQDKASKSVDVTVTGKAATERINMSQVVLIDRTGQGGMGSGSGSPIPSVLSILTDLASTAQSLWDLVHIIDKAQDALKIVTETTGDIWSALVPVPEYINVFPLTGSIGDIRDADFQMHSPYQLATDKYVTPTAKALLPSKGSKKSGVLPQQSFTQEWYWLQYLMIPINKQVALREAALQRSSLSRIVWPFKTDLPIGDPLTNPYMRIPIPAVYTDTRSHQRMDNTIDSFLSIMSGNTPNASSSRLFFEALATILDRSNVPGSAQYDPDDNPFLLPIINSLAGVMFIYVQQTSDGPWEWLQPSIPTIYGAPTASFYAQNIPGAAEDTKTAPDFSFYQNNSGRSTYLTMLSTGRRYRFTLHRYYPEPGEYVTVVVPFSRATYVAVPVLKSFWDNKPTQLEELMGHTTNSMGKDEQIVLAEIDVDAISKAIRDYDKASVKWVPCSHLYPTLMSLPHMLWDYDSTETILDDNFAWLANLSIRSEWDEYLKTMRIAGFWNSPAILLDLDDYAHAMNSADPTPLVQQSISDPTDPEPSSSEPERADAAELPNPETLAPARHIKGSPEQDQQATLAGTASVSQNPVLVNQAGAATVASAAAIPGATNPSLKQVEVTDDTPITGDPAPASQTAEAQDSVTEHPKYWKKLDGTTIVDVVKAPEAPEGYVPASEDEFADFMKKKGKSDTTVSDNSAAEEANG